jgi:hypothetical protein
MIKVFISSVSGGLEDTRAEIVQDLRTGRYGVLNMEVFGARDDLPLDTCLKELRAADVAVVIIGPRYGSLTPAGDASYTHEEFREARRRGIPVLAFVLGTDPTLRDEEKARLADFAREAGQSLTYQETTAERLSAKILAALASARDRNVLGPAYRLFQPWERFFRSQLEGVSGHIPLFNHRAPFVGREAELRAIGEFRSSRTLALILTAPGGAGKSRLLLEGARAAGASTMLFVDAGAEWTATDIRSLPAGPLILVFDDAHRRPDLDRLINDCLAQNEQIRFIVSCRPSALDIVRPHLSVLVAENSTPAQIDLPRLPKAPALELAKSSLGPDFEGLKEQLVRIADNNPLVITVGGRCIATKDVSPQVLDHTPGEFRDVVLERLLQDPALASTPTSYRRRLLDVVAAIGPIGAEDDGTREALAKFFSVKPFEIAQELDALEAVGFVQRRGRLLRVVPDVLSDHLLFRASVSAKGQPTGFLDAIVEAFSPQFLGNILANGAELDWKAAVTNAHQPVLKATWEAILKGLPKSTHRQRTELLQCVRRAALFAPDRVLEIVEWLFDNPEAPRDEALEKFGLSDAGASVTNAVADLLGTIATHPALTARALNRLWHYAEEDERPTNPNPGHPRRRIQDLLKYDRNILPRVQEAALAFVVGKLSAQERPSAPWAVEALAAALGRHGEANSATSRAFTLGSFSLAPDLETIAPRRTRAIGTLSGIAQGQRADEAVVAVRKIAGLLRKPYGHFGRDVGEAEVKAWFPEARDALLVLQRIATSASNPAIRYLARKALRGFPRKHWPELGAEVDKIQSGTPPVANELLFDILAGMPWEQERGDWREERERLKEACIAAAGGLWEIWKAPEPLVRFLLETRGILRVAAEGNYPNEWQLVGAVIEAAPVRGPEIVRAFVADGTDNGFQLVPPALDALRRTGSEADARRFVQEFANSPHEELRVRVADALRYLLGGNNLAAQDLELLRPFLADESARVQRAAVRPLVNFEKTAPKEALALLAGLDWKDDPLTGDAVCDVLHPQYALDPAALTEGQVDILLGRIERLASLEGRSHNILEFLAFASERRPRQTVEMLLRRVEAAEAHAGQRGSDRWTPIPHSGYGLSLPGLTKCAEALDLLRLVREPTPAATPLVRFWLPTLFALVAPDPRVATTVLREWLTSNDGEKIIAAATLLRGYEHGTVFVLSDFIADLLDAASGIGPECLRFTRSELYALAISGVYTGSPGKPAPRHLSDKARAAAAAESLKTCPVAKEFYDTLVRSAEESIKRDTIEFEDEEEEAE